MGFSYIKRPYEEPERVKEGGVRPAWRLIRRGFGVKPHGWRQAIAGGGAPLWRCPESDATLISGKRSGGGVIARGGGNPRWD